MDRGGEMAVWSEERWAAFERDLARELRQERRRLGRKRRGRERRLPLWAAAAGIGLAAALFIVAAVV
ncbi:MAG: hypothetical protein N2688_09650 [Burkholderiaceae bacterium]|nr:hypothetical protein [Burkholderiaceae bacterium]